MWGGVSSKSLNRGLASRKGELPTLLLLGNPGQLFLMYLVIRFSNPILGKLLAPVFTVIMYIEI
jgi:hypothetical protein